MATYNLVPDSMQDGVIKTVLYRLFPNDPEELPVRTTPSVTQNNASRSWGGAGLSVHEETVAVLAWSQCQTLLQYMCTYVCTLWCVCMYVCVHVCVHLCVCARAGVLPAPAHVHPMPPQETVNGSQLKHSWSAEARSLQPPPSCIYCCLSQCQGS